MKHKGRLFSVGAALAVACLWILDDYIDIFSNTYIESIVILIIVLTCWFFGLQYDKADYLSKQNEGIQSRLRSMLDNKEGKHALEIAGLNVTLQAGESKEITFDKPGTYDILCILPCGDGHAAMKSKLTVQ